MESTQIRIYNLSPEEFKSYLDKAVRDVFEISAQHDKSIKPEEELLTVEETIKFLKCSKQALWTWRKNGVLPSYRLGNRVFYRKSDIFSKLIKQ